MKVFILKIVSLIKDPATIREKLKRLGRLTTPRNTIDATKYSYPNLLIPISKLRFEDDFKDLRVSDQKKLTEAKVTSHKIDFQINDQNGEHFVLDLLSKGLDRSYLSAHGVQIPKKNIRVLHITGEGGSGKTTLLYKLYLDFIKKPNDLYRFIFVDLSVVNSTDHLSDFEAHASHKMLYLNTVREEILQPSNLGKKIILMIEGLDVPVRAINDQGEAISRDHKRKMINDFYHLMNDSDLIVQNIDLKMICVGRPDDGGVMSYSEAFRDAGYLNLNLQPFDQNQIKAALNKYIEASFDPQLFAMGEKEILVELICNKPELLDVIKNPSHLSMLFALDIDEFRDVENISVQKLYDRFWQNKILNEGKDFLFENMTDLKVTPQQRADFVMKTAFAKIRGFDMKKMFPQDKVSQDHLRYIEESLSTDRIFNPQTKTFFHDSFMVYAAGRFLKTLLRSKNLQKELLLFYHDFTNAEETLFNDLYQDIVHSNGASHSFQLINEFLNVISSSQRRVFLKNLITEKPKYYDQILEYYFFINQFDREREIEFDIIVNLQDPKHYPDNYLLEKFLNVKFDNFVRFFEFFIDNEIDRSLFKNITNYGEVFIGLLSPYVEEKKRTGIEIKSEFVKAKKALESFKDITENFLRNIDREQYFVDRLKDISEADLMRGLDPLLVKSLLSPKTIDTKFPHLLKAGQTKYIKIFLNSILPFLPQFTFLGPGVVLNMSEYLGPLILNDTAPIETFKTPTDYEHENHAGEFLNMIFGKEKILNLSLKEKIDSFFRNYSINKKANLFYFIFVLFLINQSNEQKLVNDFNKLFDDHISLFAFDESFNQAFGSMMSRDPSIFKELISKTIIRENIELKNLGHLKLTTNTDLLSSLVLFWANHSKKILSFEDFFRLLSRSFDVTSIYDLSSFSFKLSEFIIKDKSLKISDLDLIFDYLSEFYCLDEKIVRNEHIKFRGLKSILDESNILLSLQGVFLRLFEQNEIDMSQLEIAVQQKLNDIRSAQIFDQHKASFYLIILYDISRYKKNDFQDVIQFIANFPYAKIFLFEKLLKINYHDNDLLGSELQLLCRFTKKILEYCNQQDVKFSKSVIIEYYSTLLKIDDLSKAKFLKSDSIFNIESFWIFIDSPKLILKILSKKTLHQFFKEFVEHFNDQDDFIFDSDFNEKFIIFVETVLTGETLNLFCEKFGTKPIIEILKGCKGFSLNYIKELYFLNVNDLSAGLYLLKKAVLDHLRLFSLHYRFLPADIYPFVEIGTLSAAGFDQQEIKEFQGLPHRSFAYNLNYHRHSIYKKVQEEGLTVDNLQKISELNEKRVFGMLHPFNVVDNVLWTENSINFQIRLYYEYYLNYLGTEMIDEQLIAQLIFDYGFVRKDKSVDIEKMNILNSLIEKIKTDDGSNRFFKKLEVEITAQSEKAIDDLIAKPEWKKLENVMGRFDTYSKSGKQQIAMHLSDIISRISLSEPQKNLIKDFILVNFETLIALESNLIKHIPYLSADISSLKPILLAKSDKQTQLMIETYSQILNISNEMEKEGIEDDQIMRHIEIELIDVLKLNNINFNEVYALLNSFLNYLPSEDKVRKYLLHFYKAFSKFEKYFKNPVIDYSDVQYFESSEMFKFSDEKATIEVITKPVGKRSCPIKFIKDFHRVLREIYYPDKYVHISTEDVIDIFYDVDKIFVLRQEGKVSGISFYTKKGTNEHPGSGRPLYWYGIVTTPELQRSGKAKDLFYKMVMEVPEFKKGESFEWVATTQNASIESLMRSLVPDLKENVNYFRSAVAAFYPEWKKMLNQIAKQCGLTPYREQTKEKDLEYFNEKNVIPNKYGKLYTLEPHYRNHISNTGRMILHSLISKAKSKGEIPEVVSKALEVFDNKAKSNLSNEAKKTIPKGISYKTNLTNEELERILKDQTVNKIFSADELILFRAAYNLQKTQKEDALPDEALLMVSVIPKGLIDLLKTNEKSVSHYRDANRRIDNSK